MLHTIEGPKKGEKLIPGIDAMRKACEKRGNPTTRSTISRWRQNGYPTSRAGDRVKVPFVYTEEHAGRPMTSAGALKRFFAKVKELQDR